MDHPMYNFQTIDGEELIGNSPIFPIVKHDGEIFELIGTGFFICNFGIFVTASHVLFDVIDDEGSQTESICAFHFFGNDNYIVRPILRCNSNTVSDIAVGVLAPVLHNETGEALLNPVMVLTVESPTIGSHIVTHAYPQSDLSEHKEGKQVARFQSNFYGGELEAYYPKGRDNYLLPFPCYRGSVSILGGASGGPVCNEDGRVFGVNCTGIDGADVGHFSRINEILPLWVEDVTLDGTRRERVSIKELVDLKHIVLRPTIKFD